MKNVTTIPINDIQIGQRHRQDLGDIEALAQSIIYDGLLQPIGITPDKRLVFGYRRLLAYRDVLQKSDIPAVIIDIENLTHAEWIENTIRKDLTLSEMVAITDALRSFTRGGDRRSDQYLKNGTGVTKKEACEIAGWKLDKYDDAKKVVENAIDELVQAMDREEVSPHAAAQLAKEPEDIQQAAVKKIAKAKTDAERRGILTAVNRIKSNNELKKRRQAELEAPDVSDRCLLVPFSGSGSEMIGAINAGWDHARGIERSNKYAKLSRERLRNRNSSDSMATQDQPKIVGSELKINTITKGDCVKVIPRLPHKSINLALCSPPYAEQRKRLYPGVPENNYPLFTVDWMAKLWDKLADDGSVLIVIRPHLKKGVISDYVLKTRLALRKFGWYECEELIWYKSNGSGWSGSNRRPRRTYESILWFSKTHDPFIETKACGEWSDNLSFSGSTRFGMGSDIQDHNGHKTEKRSGRTRITDVIKVPIGAMARGVKHPAKYPQTLCEKLIKTFCPENGTVLDCFSGSGTTLLAAKATGRNFYGIDVMGKYVDLARRRLDGDSSQAV